MPLYRYEEIDSCKCLNLLRVNTLMMHLTMFSYHMYQVILSSHSLMKDETVVLVVCYVIFVIITFFLSFNAVF